MQATNMNLMLDPVNQRTKVVFGTVLGIIAAIAVVTVVITYFLLRPLALLSQQAEVLRGCMPMLQNVTKSKNVLLCISRRLALFMSDSQSSLKFSKTMDIYY